MTRNIALGAILGCVAIASIAALAEGRETRAIAFFENELKKEKIYARVLLNGESYVIEAGRLPEASGENSITRLAVLRLAYARTTAERSPALALPGTNPEDLTKALPELEKTREKLALLQNSSEQQTLVREGLYPSRFLRRVSEVERMRQTFIESGSDRDEKNYEIALRAAFAAFFEDLNAFEKAFTRVVPEDAPTYIAGNERVNRARILEAIAMLRSGIARTQRAVRERDLCLLGYTGWCQSDELALPPVVVRPTAELSKAEAETLAGVISTLLQSIPSGDPQSFTRVQLSESACVDPGKIPVVQIFPDPSGTTLPHLGLLFLGDIRMVEAGSQTQISFFSYFHERGIEYVPITPFSFYNCPSIDLDWGRALAIRDIAELARTMPLSTSVASTELKVLEKSLSRSIIREPDAERYIELGVDLARDSLLPKREELAVTEHALALRTQSAHFEDFILEIVRMEEASMSLKGEGMGIDLSAPSLFYTRSAFVPLFLGNNLTAAREHPPFFEKKKTKPNDEPYVYYSSLPRTDAVREKIINDLRFYSARLHF